MSTPSSRLEAVLSRNPFARTCLAPDSAQTQTQLFIEMFGMAADAESEAEEEWAYSRMKEAYLELAGHPTTVEHGNLPAGLWDAMRWAAELKVAREKATPPSSAR